MENDEALTLSIFSLVYDETGDVEYSIKATKQILDELF